MKKPEYNIIIIIAIALFSFATGLYLFALEKKEQDFSHNKQWSAAYLTDPGDSNLNFALENYEGKETLYAYTVFDESGNVLAKAETTLSPGEKKEINISSLKSATRVRINYKDQEKNLTTKNTVNKTP